MMNMKRNVLLLKMLSAKRSTLVLGAVYSQVLDARTLQNQPPPLRNRAPPQPLPRNLALPPQLQHRKHRMSVYAWMQPTLLMWLKMTCARDQVTKILMVLYAHKRVMLLLLTATST